MTAMEDKKKIDWETIMATKEAEGLSLSETARRFNISRGTLSWYVSNQKRKAFRKEAADVSIDWVIIRDTRIKEGLTFGELSERFGVSSEAIAIKAMEEDWPKPAEFEAHVAIKQTNDLLHKAQEFMKSWRAGNFERLKKEAENYDKLPPIDPATASDDDLAQRTKILKFLKLQDEVINGRINMGAKLLEIERNESTPVNSPIGIDFRAMKKAMEGQQGLLAGDDLIIDVSGE